MTSLYKSLYVALGITAVGLSGVGCAPVSPSVAASARSSFTAGLQDSNTNVHASEISINPDFNMNAGF